MYIQPPIQTDGGFPEPFMLQSETQSKRWSREYRSRIVREDPADIENVREPGIIEKMAIRLPELAGFPFSINALREDLQVSHQSVTRRIGMLENLLIITESGEDIFIVRSRC